MCVRACVYRPGNSPIGHHDRAQTVFVMSRTELERKKQCVIGTLYRRSVLIGAVGLSVPVASVALRSKPHLHTVVGRTTTINRAIHRVMRTLWELVLVVQINYKQNK